MPLVEAAGPLFDEIVIAASLDAAIDDLDSAQAILLGTRAITTAVIEFCRKASNEHRPPVVVLILADDPIERIVLLELGVDEVLTVPVPPRLLMARLKAVLRRRRHEAAPSSCEIPPQWSVDVLKNMAVAPDGTRVRLTATEARLMHLLLAHAGVPFSDTALANELGTTPGPALRNAISRLRRKIGQAGDDPIKSVSGAGYVYHPEPGRPPS